jgi:hypothetical protein
MTTVRRTFVVVVTGALLLLSHTMARTPVNAAEPLMTDPGGDVRYIGLEGLPQVQAEPSIDITAGDIATTGPDLQFSLDVVQLDDPSSLTDENDYASYTMGASISGDARLTVTAKRTYRHDPPTATVTVAVTPYNTAASEPVAVAFDDVGDRVTWTVPIAQVDRLRQQACPWCSPVERRSVLTRVDALTSRHFVFTAGPSGFTLSNAPTDTASTGATYRIGER